MASRAYRGALFALWSQPQGVAGRSGAAMCPNSGLHCNLRCPALPCTGLPLCLCFAVLPGRGRGGGGGSTAQALLWWSTAGVAMGDDVEPAHSLFTHMLARTCWLAGELAGCYTVGTLP